MHDPPAYVWAIIIAGPTAIAATTCIALYRGTKGAGQGQRRAALLAGATAGLLGGWFTASAVIAGHRWYPHAAVVSGPGGRVPGHAASAQPDAGGCGGVADVWPAGHDGRRSGRAAGPVPGLCGRTARQRQAAAGPASSPGRRPRGGCVAGQRDHTGDVSDDEDADRGGIGAAGHRRTISTTGPAAREPSEPGLGRLPAAGIGRIHAVTRGRAQRGSQARAAPGHRPGSRTAPSCGHGRSARAEHASSRTRRASADRESRS